MTRTILHCGSGWAGLLAFLLLLPGCRSLLGGRPVDETGRGTIGLYARIVKADSFRVGYHPVAVVTRVVPEGPVARAGIKPGDWLMSVDDSSATSAEKLIDYIRHAKPGSTVVLRVRRHGEPMTFSAKVETMK